MFNKDNSYKPGSPKSSVKKNLLISFFLVLAISGIIINYIFLHVIQITLSSEGLDSNLIKDVIRQFTVIGSGITIAGILIALFIVLYISETITQPIKKLTGGMLDIAGGKRSTRVNISSNDEFGQLAEGFNNMVKHIEYSMDELKAARETLSMPILDFNKTNKCYEYYHGTKSAPRECPSCGCLKTEEPASFEIYEPHLKKYVEIRSIPRFNNNHKLIGLIHIVRDISLRKKIEDEHNKLLIAITKAKMEWEMTFDSAMEFIVLINNELKITRCNKSFSEYVNKPVNSIVGDHCYDYFRCPSSQVEDCKNRMASSQELVAKSELETERGRWLYISHRPIQDDKEKLLKSVIIATDVTELKYAQQRIKESEKELKMKVDDLEKFYEMAIGRELRMKDLKKEIKRLNMQLGNYEEINIA